MLSYVFRNGKKKREDIFIACNNAFSFETFRNNEGVIFLRNSMLTILINDKYTHIVLKSKDVNIQKLEAFF